MVRVAVGVAVADVVVVVVVVAVADVVVVVVVVVVAVGVAVVVVVAVAVGVAVVVAVAELLMRFGCPTCSPSFRCDFCCSVEAPAVNRGPGVGHEPSLWARIELPSGRVLDMCPDCIHSRLCNADCSLGGRKCSAHE